MAKLVVIGLGLILSSTAALASPDAKTDSKKGSEAQYCLTFEDTGSHLSRTECRTKKEWKQRGVDVDELSAKNGRPDGLA